VNPDVSVARNPRGCDRIVHVDESDFSLLDVPREEPVADPEKFLRAAIAWHFGEDTGSSFWLRAAKELDFDPLTRVRSYADLGLFPNLLDELRTAPVHDLIPRGYGPTPPVPRIFESGGTTGAPKRTVQMPDWIEQVARWQVEDFSAGGFVPGSGLLALVPSGPHGVGHFDQVVSERLGSVFFPIDLDPRWVKKLAARNATQEMSGYVDHCLEQAAFVLQTQDVGNLHITPPLLEALARDDALVDLVNEQVRYVLLSGAHVDLDTMDLFREIFPDAAITMVFGSTMILSQARTRLESDWDSWIFDPQTPYIVFRVVDPETGAEVPYGERGQVVMNHISKGMFLPNNLERDTAVRVPGPNGQVGDSLTEVAPVARFEGEPVIEGVY
jgi:hypothetical protein